MLAIPAVLAALVGLLLGLLGGGGSILMLPMLVYVAGLDAKEAIASSLLVVGTTSFVGAISHAREGRVAYAVAAPFGIGGMGGAYVGGAIAHHLPARALLVLFASVMLTTSLAMLLGRDRASSSSTERGTNPPRVAAAATLGFVVGVLSGTIGAGGGFLVVPALSTLGGLSTPRAIATSLVVIAMQSLAGFVGHLGHVSLHFTLLAVVVASSVGGAVVGARLARHTSPTVLRSAFGWLVLVMALVLLGRQLPAGRTRDVATLVSIALVVLASRAAHRSRARASLRAPKGSS